MGSYDINLTNKQIRLAVNPEFKDDVMFCEGYEDGIACCDFGEDINGKHAIGIGSGIDREGALITLGMLEIIDWSDDYFKIVNGENK